MNHNESYLELDGNDTQQQAAARRGCGAVCVVYDPPASSNSSIAKHHGPAHDQVIICAFHCALSSMTTSVVVGVAASDVASVRGFLHFCLREGFRQLMH